MRNRRRWRLGLCAVMVVAAASGHDHRAVFRHPWGVARLRRRISTNTKYSPLDQITPENFTDLEIAWRWQSLSTAVANRFENIQPRQFKATPLMVGGRLYVSTALGQVAALDAGTGELVWSYDPRTYDRLDRPANVGWQHRGVSYWEDDSSGEARIFIATHDLRLVALDARTGVPAPDFGAGGVVDLSGSLGRPVDRARITHSSPVAIAGDTVVVGSVVRDRTETREAPPDTCAASTPVPAR